MYLKELFILFGHVLQNKCNHFHGDSFIPLTIKIKPNFSVGLVIALKLTVSRSADISADIAARGMFWMPLKYLSLVSSLHSTLYLPVQHQSCYQLYEEWHNQLAVERSKVIEQLLAHRNPHLFEIKSNQKRHKRSISTN